MLRHCATAVDAPLRPTRSDSSQATQFQATRRHHIESNVNKFHASLHRHAHIARPGVCCHEHHAVPARIVTVQSVSRRRAYRPLDSYPQEIDVRDAPVLLVAAAGVARSLALRRDLLERAARHLAEVLFLPAHGRQRDAGRVEPVRLEALERRVVVRPAKRQRVLRRLVAQDQLLVDLVAAEGAHRVRVEVRQDVALAGGARPQRRRRGLPVGVGLVARRVAVPGDEVAYVQLLLRLVAVALQAGRRRRALIGRVGLGRKGEEGLGRTHGLRVDQVGKGVCGEHGAQHHVGRVAEQRRRLLFHAPGEVELLGRQVELAPAVRRKDHHLARQGV